MTTITISIPDDRLAKLKEIADRFGITPADLLQFSVAELVTKPDDSFQQAADYVLGKNDHLYQHLA